MRRWLIGCALLVSLGSSGCAVQGGGENGYASAPPAPAAARVGLAPMLRPFYDELEPYGEWILIEPFGWVFRPRVNTAVWRPYEMGWWDYSDAFGWYWNSDEPFGWITYHYGAWFYDDYQGWVWQPAPYWAPAWVVWVQADDYLGWAALPPIGVSSLTNVPGGVFTFVPSSQLASRASSAQSSYVLSIGHAPADLHEVLRMGAHDGVAFNRGPDPGRLGLPSFGVGNETEPRLANVHATTPLTESNVLDRSNRLLALARPQLRAGGALPGTGTRPTLPIGGGAVSRPAPPVQHPEASPISPGLHPEPRSPLFPAVHGRDSTRVAPRDTSRAPGDSSKVRPRGAHRPKHHAIGGDRETRG